MIPSQHRDERAAPVNEKHDLESKIEEKHWALLTISLGAEMVSPIHRHRVFSLMHTFKLDRPGGTLSWHSCVTMLTTFVKLAKQDTNAEVVE